ncbi:HET-domain-containing protein [Xylariaceae sp. AK1471]|nr:HET-domain-containing protein [Xylariaceae sp. AK1471]
MAANMTRFAHEALRSNDIRLIDLGQLNADGRPQLTLKSFARADAPEYVSISYCWGQEDDCDFIYLNGATFATRPNLNQLLLSLRDHCPEYPEWRLFWIDAICIDQNNANEKTEQVRRMDETYKDAVATVVWLGTRETPSDKPVAGRDHTSKLASPSLVDEIFSRPYWSRIWIIQELLLAKDIIPLYGHLRFTWRGLTGSLQPWAVFGKSKWRHSALTRLILMVGGVTYSPRNGGVLGELMRSLAHSECSDPRDRVFALLSLVAHEERALLGSVFPDYNMSHEKQIYAPRPFKWMVKPEQVWNPAVFGLDRETWQALWRETEGYEILHDLTNFAKVWNPTSVGRLLRLDKAAETLQQQKAKLKQHRDKWFRIREDALRRLAHDSKR